MKALNSNTAKIAFAAAFTVAAGASHAAIDTSSITASLTDAEVAVAAIGAAVLGVVVIVKTFKYIRGAF
jgi:hypothetical protein